MECKNAQSCKVMQMVLVQVNKRQRANYKKISLTLLLEFADEGKIFSQCAKIPLSSAKKVVPARLRAIVGT